MNFNDYILILQTSHTKQLVQLFFNSVGLLSCEMKQSSFISNSLRASAVNIKYSLASDAFSAKKKVHIFKCTLDSRFPAKASADLLQFPPE